MALVATKNERVARVQQPGLARHDQLYASAVATQVLARAALVRDTGEVGPGLKFDAGDLHSGDDLGQQRCQQAALAPALPPEAGLEELHLVARRADQFF